MLNRFEEEDSSCYFEIKVLCAGSQERNYLGLHGSNVYYSGRNGKILYKNKLISYAPRFGSFDTIGMGFYPPNVIF